MSREKLVFEPYVFNQERKNPLVRLNTDAAKAINKIVMQTGLPISEVASAMILYAEKFVEVRMPKLEFNVPENRKE